MGQLEPTIKEISWCSCIILNIAGIKMELKSQSKLFLFIQMLFLGTSVQSTNYVKIDDSSQHDCPKREPCLTLTGYINESTRYFITGSTFVFLPGNHSQQNSFNNLIINDISDMIWKGNESKSNNVIIISYTGFHLYNVTNFTIEGLSFNTSIFAIRMSTILFSSSVFQRSVAITGRAVYSVRSSITIINTTFEGNRGGAIMVTDHSTLKLTGTTFIGNEEVNGIGGAICALSQSYILLNGAPRNLFSQNHSKKGGAIMCLNCIINMARNNTFENNHASEGGAAFIADGLLTITGTANFSENKATVHGGALYLAHSHGLINEAHINFYKNTASSGGAAVIDLSSLNITGTANFSGNNASQNGGALYLFRSQVLINGTNICFSKNSALYGGGLFIKSERVDSFIQVNLPIFISANFTGNLGGAAMIFESNVTFNNINVTAHEVILLYIAHSSVLFEGTNTFSENHGAMYSFDTSLAFSGNSLFYHNSVHGSGGAIISSHGNLSFTGSTSFINNSPLADDGAIQALLTSLTFSGISLFYNNSVHGSGGAIISFYGNLSFTGSTSFINNSALADDALLTSLAFNGNSLFYHNSVRYSGGAIISLNGNLSFTGSTSFINNSALDGGAIYALNTSLAFSGNSLFCNNSVHGSGGAIISSHGNLSFTGSTSFINNSPLADGGAIQALLTLLTFSGNSLFYNNSVHGSGGAIISFYGNLSFTGSTSFINNSALADDALLTSLAFSGNSLFYHNSVRYSGGAIISLNGNLSFTGSTSFINNSALADGGAIYALNTSLAFSGNSLFCNNSVHYSGGAIISSYGNLSFTGNTSFINNLALANGGAIYTLNASLAFSGNSLFCNNSVHYSGGAIISSYGNLSFTRNTSFINNSALKYGGAIHALQTSLAFSGNTLFYHNSVRYGGAIFSSYGNLSFTGSTSFINNSAVIYGGAIHALQASLAFSGNSLFYSNSVYIKGGAIISRYGALSFTGSTSFINNSALIDSGAIYALQASLAFSGNSLFYSNSADNRGGAIFSRYGALSFTGSTAFINNSALKGGAIYASRAGVTFDNTLTFLSNSAQNGGAMYFTDEASLTLTLYANLNLSYNRATDYGGAIYHKDIVTPDQCSNDFNSDISILFPTCFLQLITERGSEIKTTINSYYNSAGKDGNFLHGGLLDRCILKIYPIYQTDRLPYDYFIDEGILSLDNRTEQITSEPLQLCFCNMYDHMVQHKCGNNEKRVELQRGQELNVSLLAFGQRWTITPTTVTAVGKNIRFKQNQTSQTLSRQCSSLYYNLYSSSESGKLELYPDGPCRDTGLAKAVIHVTFFPCPDGFSQQGEECACEKRLQKYGAQCINGKQSFIRRKNTSTFWMNVLRSPNDSYLGLILYHSCPHDYCTTESVDISLDDLDIQCSPHRTGVLCGECTNNYSLMLGGSRCAQCSHNYLSLLIPFALAGIVLIVFLSFFRLTVAYGMINSLILYANIVQVNRRLFFSTDTVNILTVFVAWLNLDLGFQTCFFNGLDAYLQTWLQFAFPLYVWLLIIIIIITSRYSMTVSKLIGTNPISVLATLILMSYAKILQVIIGVFSSVNLDYPHDKKVRVWLKDANVHYLHSKHLFLAVMTVMVVIFFLLPYTLFLLLGPRLYRISPRKCIHLLAWIKPLLDSYYAPYKKNTRYWTGFLLVIRCILYIVFSYNSLGDINNSLLAIVITFTGIGFIAWISGRVYKSFIVELIESFIYINLIILSAATLTQVNKTALVNALVGTVFAAMIAITISQFYLLYVSKTNLWLKIKGKVSACLPCLNKKIKDATPAEVIKPPRPPGRIVTQTVVELREPLLEN